MSCRSPHGQADTGRHFAPQTRPLPTATGKLGEALVVPAGGTWNTDARSALAEPHRAMLTRDSYALAVTEPFVAGLRNHAMATRMSDLSEAISRVPTNTRNGASAMADPTQIERLIHDGRSLVAYDDADGRVIGWPEMAYESIRAINHLTSRGQIIPAPTLYNILGELKGVGHLLPQALEQLGRGLSASLDQLDVTEDDQTRDPRDSVATALSLLDQAAKLARDLGATLESAQAAIAGQGYKSAGD